MVNRFVRQTGIWQNDCGELAYGKSVKGERSYSQVSKGRLLKFPLYVGNYQNVNHSSQAKLSSILAIDILFIALQVLFGRLQNHSSFSR